MKVPVYEQQTGVRAPNPAPAPNLVPLPREAFGGAVAREQGALGETVGKISDVLARHIQARDQQEAERTVLASETAFRKDMQAALYDPEQGDDGVPKGIMNRRLGAAKGATVALDATYTKLREKYISAAADDRQREMLGKLMDTNYAQERDTVVRHEAAQFTENYQNTLDSNMVQRITEAAGITTPAALEAHLGQSLSVLKTGLTRQGLDKASQDVKAGELAKDMTLSYLKVALEKDPALARQSLEKIQHSLPADIYGQVEGKVVEADFNNALQKLRLNGGNLADAVALAGNSRYFRNDSEKAGRMEGVKKAYATSDPNIYLDVWEKVQAGQIQPAALDSYHNSGKLSLNDWTALRKDLFNAYQKGAEGNYTGEMKLAWDMVKARASEKISNTDDKAIFLYELHRSSVGMNPTELAAKAESLLKSPGMFSGTRYKSQFETRIATQKEAGDMQLNYGRALVSGLGDSLLREKKIQSPEEMNQDRITDLAAEIGLPPEDLLSGTPVNAMINEMAIRGKRLNADTIRDVLTQAGLYKKPAPPAAAPKPDGKEYKGNINADKLGLYTQR